MSKFAIPKQNVKYIIIGFILIILGYVLMVGGGSDSPDVFSEDMFDFRRIVLSPVLIIAGFVIEVIAIMKRPK